MPSLDQVNKKQTQKPTLPSDVPTLQAMVVESHLLIEKLKLQIARMKRVRFGASSEQLDAQILQLELIVEDLETSYSAVAGHAAADEESMHDAASTLIVIATSVAAASHDSRVRALPDHLPRERVRYEPQAAHGASNTCGCKHCGARLEQLTHLGDAQSEMLEYVPGRFKVIVAVRPKYLCGKCSAISQAPSPSRPLVIATHQHRRSTMTHRLSHQRCGLPTRPIVRAVIHNVTSKTSKASYKPMATPVTSGSTPRVKSQRRRAGRTRDANSSTFTQWRRKPIQARR
jgi:hypothetical protein